MSLYVDVPASSHLQRKTIVGSWIMFFFCPLKIVKSVWFEISLLTVQTLFHYYTYCQVTTQQPSSRRYDREKGVCCGFWHFI